VFNQDPNRPDRPDRYQSPGAPQGSPWGSPAPGSVTPNTLGAGVRTGAVPREGFLTLSFIWMFLALLVSAGAAYLVMNNVAVIQKVSGAFIVLIIVELVLVVAITGLINRIGAIPALALLFVYAAINGLVLGVIVYAYSHSALGVQGVVSAFAGSSAIFGGAAVYGVATKRDLTGLGGILFMGLIGLLVVMLVQIFLFPGSGIASLLIGIVGVLIFTGLTAFDVQRIQKGAMPGIKDRESASVIGALALYLDFVNLFLFMLRIFGSSRN
jgi:FtsH-binding integral membrane protein